MTWWEALGWLGNVCYFARFLVQWWASERAGRSVAPRLFWWLSLAGTLALGSYTAWRGEPVLLAGYVINGSIYVRNLRLDGRRVGAGPRLARLVLLGLLATAGLFATGLAGLREDLGEAPLWLAFGVAGQGLWCTRFVVQWLHSEHRGESHFPVAFWWVSLGGNALLLAYAVHLGDAIWIAGMVPGPLVQARNLVLEARARDGRRQAAPPA